MLGKRGVSFKHNFQNEQVENGGGHVYRSVKRERVANKSFEDIKAIPTSTCAHTLEKRVFLFLFRPSLFSESSVNDIFFSRLSSRITIQLSGRKITHNEGSEIVGCTTKEQGIEKIRIANIQIK